MGASGPGAEEGNRAEEKKKTHRARNTGSGPGDRSLLACNGHEGKAAAGDEV